MGINADSDITGERAGPGPARAVPRPVRGSPRLALGTIFRLPRPACDGPPNRVVRRTFACEAVAESGETRADVALDAARAELERVGIEPEYLEARYAEGLAPAESLNGRPVLVAVAAQVGRARLIDNLVIGG